jgi:hypothetical protein
MEMASLWLWLVICMCVCRGSSSDSVREHGGVVFSLCALNLRVQAATDELTILYFSRSYSVSHCRLHLVMSFRGVSECARVRLM